jgi:flagellar biosynthesis protein FlhB
MKSFDEKTEPATPKRRQEARSKGDVAKSADLNTAMLMLFGTLLIYFLGGALVWDIQDTMSLLFRNPFYENFNVNTLHSLLVDISSKHVKTVLPVIGGFMVIGIISSYSQVGFNFAPKALMPDFKKMDPIKGLKNLVSKRALVNNGDYSIFRYKEGYRTIVGISKYGDRRYL